MTPSPATWWMTSSCPCWRAAPPRPVSRNERQEQQPVSLATFSPQELQRFTQTFEDLFYAADPAPMTSYYTEHAQLMADGIRPIQGHAAITEFWRAAITRAAAARARRTIRLHESHSSGGLGYALCTVE